MTFDNLQKRNRWIKGGTLKGLSLSALFLFSFLFLINLVSAVPPVQSTIVAPEGLEIEATNFEYLQQNVYHVFRFRVYNATNNVYLDDDDVNCSFGIVNSQGEFIFNLPAATSSEYIFSVNVTAANFSKIGIYHVGINCITNDGTTAGGVKTLSFEVTDTGKENFNYWFIVLGTALAILFLIFSILTPEEFFVYISGVFFLIEGIYIMINGFSLVNDANTRMFAFIYLGIGILFTVGAYVFNLYSNSNNEEEEEY